jgi:selenide,water dikinase
MASDDLMVGFETSDDAAVYRLDDDTALLLTVDFFTPIVDDPYDFGRITAANALSDIYAMGGRPLTAMNMVAFPCSLGPEVVAEVLRGGGDVCREAGAIVVGGHTIDDNEPKFGLSVLGIVHPDKVIRNVGAAPGDVLVLTKPLGTGIIGTALKRGLEDETSARTAIESMAALNRLACEAMQEVGVSAATDVTGFGIAGHLHEMLEGSGCAGELSFDALPLLERALEYAAQGVVPGRTADVIAYAAEFMEWDAHPAPLGPDAPAADLVPWRILCDPQTSGGLLIAVPPEKSDRLLQALAARGVLHAVIGRARAGAAGRVHVI